MDSIQFEPKIVGDLQIDWRRRSSGQGSDMFADLLAQQLKRRSEADQQDIATRRREDAAPQSSTSEPVSNRPTRVVLAHARTIAGEAKKVPACNDRRLPDRSDQTSDEESIAATGDKAAPDKAAAGTKATGSGESEDKESDTAADATGDQTEQSAGDQQQPTAPLVVVAVAAQPTEQKTGACAQEIVVPTPDLPVAASTDDQGPLPTPARSDDTKAGAGQQPSAATGTEQPTIETAAQASLAAALSALGVDGTETPAATDTPDATPQVTVAAVAPTGKQPLLQAAQAMTQVADLMPPQAQPQPPADRPAIEIKLRSAPTAHPTVGTPDPSPSQAAAQQPIHAPAAALLQPGAIGDGGSDGDTFDQSLSGDSSGPGWAFHLAQGAAGKRADFIAQLKQHLQDLPAHEQVAVHIQRALREGTNKFSIQLSPAELGRVHVKLEIDEDKRVTAAVTAERPSTLELLQRDIKGLERALHDAGLNMEAGDLSFSLGRGDQDFAQDLNQSAVPESGGMVADRGSEADQPEIEPAQVTDTAAGVVNLQV